MLKQERKRKENLLPKGIPRWVRCYDSGGSTADRYTVVFTGRYKKNRGECIFLGMSEKPFHPQGFCQHGFSPQMLDTVKGGWPPSIGKKCCLGTRIPFTELPEDCQKVVINDYKELWDISN